VLFAASGVSLSLTSDFHSSISAS